MKRFVLAGVCAALALAAAVAPSTFGSSHREAPNILLDPTADNTDTYAFVAPNAPRDVTLVGNWIPGENPANGPNFFRFDDRAYYYINIDNTGDGKTDIRYLFKFATHLRDPNIALYAIPPVNSVFSKNLNVFQTYNVTRETFSNGRPRSARVIARNLPVAPSNVGPKTMPNYQRLADQATRNLPGGGKVFAGQRDDSFFIDLGAAFDSINITMNNTENGRARPANTTGNAGGGVDTMAGTNIETIALQVPKSDVTRDGKAVSSSKAGNAVVGVWDSTNRAPLQVTNANFQSAATPASSPAPRRPSSRFRSHHPVFAGAVRSSGFTDLGTVQVSRLGNPLVNELIIPIPKKDEFNRTAPQDDVKNFGRYVLNPNLAALINALFPSVKAPEHNRTDIVQALLTGIPGVTQISKRPAAADTLKINLGVPPTTTPNRFGVLGGDMAGFPNGRRLSDDVTAISLQVVAGYLKGNKVPLGDGVDQNDKPFLNTFPYLAGPTSGYDNRPSNRTEPPHAPTPASPPAGG